MAATRPTADATRDLPAEASVQDEKDCTGRDKLAPPEVVSPRAGRTGGQGTRAEKPSDGTARKGEEDAEPRKGKPPSPNA